MVHRILIDHEANLALAVGCGDHIHPLPLRFHWQHWRMAFRRKAALHHFTIAYTRFVAPVDIRILSLCTRCNGRIFLILPPLDALRILFPGTLRWTLAAHTPAPHIIRQCPLIYSLAESLLDVLPRSPQRPQHTVDAEILRSFLRNGLLNI